MNNLENRVKQLEGTIYNFTKNIVRRVEKSEDIISSSLIKPKVEEEKVNPLKPKIGQKYWFVVSDGNYDSCDWGDYGVDNDRLAVGSIFLSEQAVKDEIAKRRAIQTIRTYIAIHFPCIITEKKFQKQDGTM